MDFEARKLACLRAMASSSPDKSRKGTVDAPIAPLIARINSHPAFFTTSSCSGRISISQELLSPHHPGCHTAQEKRTKGKMKGGDWCFVSHSQTDALEFLPTVLDCCARRDEEQQQLLGPMVFRFEPFILAVECLSLSAAQALVSCAISSGFRESGVTSMRKRIIVAVRCSIRIEAPIAEAGRLMVNEDYLKFLVRIANEKMATNHRRTDKFFSAFIEQLERTTTDVRHSSIHSTGQDMREQSSSVSIYEEAKNRSSQEQKSEAKNLVLRRRKLAELEKRQTRVLSRIHALETLLRDSIPDLTESSDGACPVILKGGMTVDGLCSRTEVSIDSPIQGMDAMPGPDMVVKDGCAELNQTNVPVELECTGLQEGSRRAEQSCNDLKEEGRYMGMIFEKLDSMERLYRWGHSTCLFPCVSSILLGSLLIFGGYGGSIRQCRQNDLLMLDCANGKLQEVCAKNPPSPRMGHTASVVKQKMVVIGGREDPSKPLGDVCVLDLDKMQWMYPSVGGAWFPPRHRHAAVTVGEKICVFGGLNNLDALGDFYVLDISIMQWRRIECVGDVPCPRHSHSLSIIDQNIYLFGGFDGSRILGDLYVLDLANFVWHMVKSDSLCRFSHTMTVTDRDLLLLGGCPLTNHMSTVSILNVDTMEWRHGRLRLPIESLFVRHTANYVVNQLVLIGGGISCYAFGTKFSPPFLVNLALLLSHMTSKSEKGPRTFPNPCLRDEDKTDDHVWGIKTHKIYAKSCKDTLKWLGWLDLKRKVRVDDDGLHILFPITKKAAGDLDTEDGKNLFMARFTPNEKILKGFRSVKKMGNVMNWEIVKSKLLGDLKSAKTPQGALRDAIFLLLQKHDLPTSLLQELPKRWERLDDMAVLPANSFRSKIWCSLGQELWKTVANSLNVCRVAHQAPVKATGTRDSNLVVILGDNGWVRHCENGILYCFDATKCMFSSGNISEKLRIAQMDCSGETVVDLFAGIGYFVLPFLVKANARRVFACEWNLPALDALRYNLHVNMVEDRCTVLEGDNRMTAPQGVADRVCLGLLPTSELSWEVAVKALRCEGGMLHIHGNAKDTEEQQWIDYVYTSIKNLSRRQERHWDVHVAHIERVKWYAPHIRHMVVDVKCEVVV